MKERSVELRGLTPKGLQSLKASGSIRDVPVIGMPCLKIRVERTGTLTPRVVRELPRTGRRVAYVLGTFRRGPGRLTGLSLQEIRTRYERAMRLIDDGIHPAEEDQREREAAETRSRNEALSMTVERAVALFVNEHLAKLTEHADGTWYRDPDNRAIPNNALEGAVR